MFSEEIRSMDIPLATLAGEVDSASWEVIRQVRRNLSSLADQLENAEKYLEVPEVQNGQN